MVYLTNRSVRAFRSTLVVSGFGYAAQALSLAAIPLYLTSIGAENYGLMVTVMALMGYLGFADAGLSWGSMILIAQAHGRNGRNEIAHIVRHSVVLALGSGVLVAVILGVVMLLARAGWRLPMFALHPGADRLLFIAACQLGMNLQFGIFYNLFQGLQENHWTGFYQGGARLVGLGGGMLAAWATHSVEVVMWVQLVATVLSGAAASLHALRRHPWAFAPGRWDDAAQYRRQLSVGGKNFLIQIGRTLSNTAPTLGISSIMGPSFVAYYTVPTTLLGMFFSPMHVWSATMQSAYGEAWVAGDRAWVRDAFRKGLERILIVGGLGVVIFLPLGDSFIRLWTAGALSMEPLVAVAIAGIALIGTLLTAGQYLLTGLNQHRRAGVAEIANGVLGLILVPLALYWWGLPGVGLGVIGAALATSAWVLRREIRTLLGPLVAPSPLVVFKAVAVAGVSLAAAIITRAGLEQTSCPHAVQLVAIGFVAVASYLTLGFGLKLVPPADAIAVTHWLRARFVPGTAI